MGIPVQSAGPSTGGIFHGRVVTESTSGTVSAERLARLPEGSLLVVASRGGIVDEAAALRSVRDGLLRGVAFDVFQDREAVRMHGG